MYPRVRNVLPLTSLKNVIVVDFAGEPEGLDVGHRSFGDFLQTDAPPAPQVPIDPTEDVAALQYTGGTTGVSKGAMLTHRNLVANVQQALDVFIDDPGAFSNNQKVMGILPMFHIFGLTCVMLFAIKQGLNQLLLPKFDPQEVMDLVKEHGPVMFSGVPTMYMALNSSDADLLEYAFGNVRTYNTGGSALPVPLKRSFEEKTGRPASGGDGLSAAQPRRRPPGAPSRRSPEGRSSRGTGSPRPRPSRTSTRPSRARRGRGASGCPAPAPTRGSRTPRRGRGRCR